MVCPYLPPEVYGGKEVWIYKTAKELSTLGHDVTIWTSTVTHNHTVATREDGVRVFRSPVVANLRTYWTPIVSPSMPVAGSFDLFHLAEPYATGSTFAAVEAKLSGTPIVVSYHNDPLPLRAYSLPPPIKLIYDFSITTYGRTINLLKLSWARKIVVFSRAQLERSVYLRGKLVEKVEIIPMGVDESLLENPTSAGGFVLFVGRIDFRKGVHHLITAMEGIDRDLLLVGSGDVTQLKYIQDLGQRTLGDRFRMLGKISEEHLHKLYAACDVLVLPSVDPMETFGGVVVEAMAAGKAVVCTSIVGISNLVSRTRAGVVVKTGSPSDLHEGIQMVLRDRNAALEMGRRGRLVAADFTYDKVARRLLSVYEDALRERAA